MRKKQKKLIVPKWILYHLQCYGNCCCGREIVVQIGEEKLLDILKQNGYICRLKIVPEYRVINKRLKYPSNAFYILEEI